MKCERLKVILSAIILYSINIFPLSKFQNSWCFAKCTKIKLKPNKKYDAMMSMWSDKTKLNYYLTEKYILCCYYLKLVWWFTLNIYLNDGPVNKMIYKIMTELQKINQQWLKKMHSIICFGGTGRNCLKNRKKQGKEKLIHEWKLYFCTSHCLLNLLQYQTLIVFSNGLWPRLHSKFIQILSDKIIITFCYQYNDHPLFKRQEHYFL